MRNLPEYLVEQMLGQCADRQPVGVTQAGQYWSAAQQKMREQAQEIDRLKELLSTYAPEVDLS